MDIQKIINDVVSKLNLDPALLKTLKKKLGIDLPEDQINKVIEGIKGKIDLSKVDLKGAGGILAKIKGLFGK